MERSEITVLSAVAFVLLTVVGITILEFSGSAPTDRIKTDRAYTSGLDSSNAQLKGFTGISARGTWRVIVTQGDEWRVDLIYPDAARDRLLVRVEGERLALAQRSESWRFWKNWGSGSSAPTAHVVMPALSSLQVSGASETQFSGFSGNRLNVRVSGAGKVNGTDGQYKSLALSVSGAGDADMRDITFTDAQTRLSGAGKVSLTMGGGVLSGTISGAGKITYRGSISDMRVSTTGAAVVRHVD